tara:strand:- start:959 stop:1216 length:258 start_codon:yes stop_codon:yes gene_type:complete
MSRIFKKTGDDATEETLKAIHLANRVDDYYERGWTWIKVILASVSTAFILSAFEYYTDWNLWAETGSWIKEGIRNLLGFNESVRN